MKKVLKKKLEKLFIKTRFVYYIYIYSESLSAEYMNIVGMHAVNTRIRRNSDRTGK